MYRVNPVTGERRTVRRERTYNGADSNPFELNSALPPCRCPIHREGEGHHKR